MDRSDHEVAAPVALYEGPRVTFFRGWKLIALVAVCVGVGVALHAALAAWQQSRLDHLVVDVALVPPEAPPQSPSGEVAWPMTLPGPADATVTMAGIAVLHVWLQGCQDCMPAFEAMRRLAPERWLSVPTYNVAYGSADPSWARSYGVDTNLAFDDGSHLVRPLGIGTFTTLVMDEQGGIVRVGSPAQADFRARLTQAVDEATRAARKSSVDPTRIAETLAYLRGRSGELRRCVDWGRGATESIVVSLRVAPEGAFAYVQAAPATSAAADAPSGPLRGSLTAECVERELGRWQLGTPTPFSTELRVQLALGGDDRGE